MGDPWEFEIPVLETIIFRGELLVLGRVCFFFKNRHLKYRAPTATCFCFYPTYLVFLLLILSPSSSKIFAVEHLLRTASNKSKLKHFCTNYISTVHVFPKPILKHVPPPPKKIVDSPASLCPYRNLTRIQLAGLRWGTNKNGGRSR